MTQFAYESEIEAAKAALLRAKKLLQDEISSYPQPISGCDAQYVRLISDRTRLSGCLQVLDDRPFVATPRMLEPAS